MAGRYRRRRKGEPVKVRGMTVPFTFWPESYVDHGRVITSDPWRCLSVHIHQSVDHTPKRNRALAFLEQAEDFHHAAAAPRIGSRPLLHYYSFMNLAKAFLVVEKGLKLDRCMHGLREPDDNIRKRLTITSQSVKPNDSGGNRTQVYREFITQCGFSVPAKPKPYKLVDLLGQMVSIHGVISLTMKRLPQFFPIHGIAFECDPDAKEAWIAFYVSKNALAANSSAARGLRENTTSFEEVESPKPGFRRYESRKARGYKVSPLQVLRQLVLDTWKDIWSELRPGGYRFWASTIPSAKRLAQLAAGYQAMFYFGSVARYRPDDFQKLAKGKHGWMVQEFINNQPLQFVYFLGSGLLGSEMVIPALTTR